MTNEELELYKELQPEIREAMGGRMKEISNCLGYSIDEAGNVFSHRRKVGKGKGEGRGTTIIIDYLYFRKLKPTPGRGGYPTVYLSGNLNKGYYIHRLVAETFISNPENKPCVNHIDFNINNPHVSNLEWVTHSENNKHSVIHGRMGGEHSNFRKLTSAQVIEIRKLSETKMKRKDIAAKYGIIPDYVRAIQRRLAWANI